MRVSVQAGTDRPGPCGHGCDGQAPGPLVLYARPEAAARSLRPALEGEATGTPCRKSPECRKRSSVRWKTGLRPRERAHALSRAVRDRDLPRRLKTPSCRRWSRTRTHWRAFARGGPAAIIRPAPGFRRTPCCFTCRGTVLRRPGGREIDPGPADGDAPRGAGDRLVGDHRYRPGRCSGYKNVMINGGRISSIHGHGGRLRRDGRRA